MYILTNIKNEIIAISSIYEVDEQHRNIIVDTYNIAYGPREKINSYEVADVPEEVVEVKYCYEPEKGFYLNKRYVEPSNNNTRMQEIEAKNAELEEQITELQLAMVEMAESEV